jgi:hypothetical protein
MNVASILLVSALCAAPVFAHEGGYDARGVVTSVVPQELIIRTSHGEEKFLLTPDTQFVKDGSPAAVQDLKPSDRVVVHAKKKGGRLEAFKVQFSRRERPAKRLP